MEIPTLPINDRFTIELVCDQNYQESVEIFINGHINNPFMKAVQATKEEVYRFYSYKHKIGVKTRPLQQYSVRDKLNNNKIVGTLLTQHFVHTKQNQKQFKEGLKQQIKGSKALQTRFDYDQLLENPQVCKQFIDEIEETQNPFLYAQVSIAVLPEYFKFGLFQQMADLCVYAHQQYGGKGYVDVIHNHGTGHVAKKYFGGIKINEIFIRDHLYEGKKVFDTEDHVVQLVHSTLKSDYSQKIMNNDEKYYEFYQKCVQYIKYQNVQRKIKDIPLKKVDNIQLQQLPQLFNFSSLDNNYLQQQYRQTIYPRI